MTGPMGAEGNIPAQERILRYLRGGRVHPALLLVGPDAQVKRDVARGMARYLMGGDSHLGDRVMRGIHPDVVWLGDEEDDILKIESVRSLCHQMEISALEGGAKVAVVDECHRLNAAAANAFLKTLEEPGERRFFILLTSQPGSLLPTILSRCVQFSFQPEDQAVATNPQYDEALTALSQSGDIQPVLGLLKDKDECLALVRYLQQRIRDRVVGADPAPWLPPVSDPKDLLRTFHAVGELEGRMRSNANHSLATEALLRQHFQGTLQ